MKKIILWLKEITLWPDPAQPVNKAFTLYRVLVLAYLIAILIQAFASSEANQFAFSFLSKMLAVVIMICSIIILEAIRFCIRRCQSNQIFILIYMVLSYLILSILSHEAAVQEHEHQQQGLLIAEYPFMILKSFFLIMIPNHYLRCTAFMTDTAYFFAREPDFHNVGVIEPVLVTLMIALLLFIYGRPSKDQEGRSGKSHSRSELKEDLDWMKEILNNLQDGVAVFKLDGTLRYSNPGLLTILEANEENLVDVLVQLPNKDFLSQNQDLLSISPLRSHSKSTPMKPPSSHSFGTTTPMNSNQQFLSFKKSTFYAVSQIEKPLSSRKAISRSNSMCELISDPLVPENPSPISPYRMNTPKKDNLKEDSLDGVLNPPLLSDMTKFGTNKDIYTKTHETTPKNPTTPKFEERKTQQEQQPVPQINASKSHPVKSSSQPRYSSEGSPHTKGEKTVDDQALNYNPFGENVKAQLLKGIKYCNFESVGEAINMILSKSSQRSHQIEDSSALGLLRAARASSRSALRNTPKGKLSHFLYHYTEEEQEITDSMYMNSFIRGSAGELSRMKSLEIVFNLIPHNDGDDKLLVVTVRDSTCRAMVQKLKDMNDRKNEALATASHEFRAPLNGIVSMLELLAEKVKPSYEQMYIRPALVNSKRLLSLANDILDYYQYQNNKLRLVHAPCSLRDIIQNVFKILEIPANLRGLELDYKIDQRVPLEIVTDSSRLEQILLNLASNSFKFTESGGIYISVTTPRPGKVQFQVKDTGIGIKEASLSNLFKTFGRVELEAKASLNPNGVGLGLVISNALSKSLNSDEEEGGLKVESVYGKGSCFYFTIDDCAYTEQENFYFSNEGLPPSLTFSPNSTVGSPFNSRFREIPSFVNSKRTSAFDPKVFGTKLHIQNHDMKTPGRIKRINKEEDFQIKDSMVPNWQSDQQRFSECSTCMTFLAIDDDDFNIYAIKNLLFSFGFHNFEYSSNGLDALKKIKNQAQKNCHTRYRMIFLDCEMPIINGYDTAKEIRRLEREQVIPVQVIIGVTGNAGSEKLEECLRSGMNDTIVKPLTKQNLYEKIDKWFPQD